MFGTIVINPDELKIKDYRKYRSYYCGVCQDLKELHGQTSRLTLTYDMTFLALLLTGLYEREGHLEKIRCPLHPMQKLETRRNAYTQYAADMNVLLSYYNLLDDWIDEKKVGALAVARKLRPRFLEVCRKYPRQNRAVRSYMRKLMACEREKDPNMDRAAGYTGELMEEIFVYKKDEWEKPLRRMGFFLGKFIYLMDALRDVEEDIKNDNYNPFRSLYGRPDFEKKGMEILTMMAADYCQAFEQLPIIEEIDILRNVLYSGIWTKYWKKKSEEKM